MEIDWRLSKITKIYRSSSTSHKLGGFFLGLLVRSVSGEDIRFVGKKELFSPLAGWFFKYLGGVPVDRSGNMGSVESIIEVFNSHKKFRIALAPEGTRKKVNKLRTGYYFIARN